MGDEAGAPGNCVETELAVEVLVLCEVRPASPSNQSVVYFLVRLPVSRVEKHRANNQVNDGESHNWKRPSLVWRGFEHYGRSSRI